METQRDFKVLNGFILKIMAIIFMTLDHVGMFLARFENLYVLSSIFRILGRLSFPLFIFLLVEGIIHTKNTRNYFIRLGLLALAFLGGQIVYFYLSDHSMMLSPAFDLILTAALVYLLKRKDKFSFFAIIPFGWALATMIIRNYEFHHLTYLSWFPFFLRPDYSLFGPLLGIAFYYANDLAKLFLKSNNGTQEWIGTSYERTAKNIISAGFLIILSLIFALLERFGIYLVFTIPWQVYALFAFIPILLYSGKRGYNAKWFQYGCYIYFPVHLVLIFLIFSLI